MYDKIKEIEKELVMIRTLLEFLSEVSEAMMECLDIIHDKIDEEEERELDTTSKAAVELDNIFKGAFKKRF